MIKPSWFVLGLVLFWAGVSDLRAEIKAATAAPSSLDFTLDNGNGNFALYPGKAEILHEARGDRGFLFGTGNAPQKLPQGAHVYWQPFERDSSGEPVLFAAHEFGKLQIFCQAHRIQLVVSEVPPLAWSTIDSSGTVKLMLIIDKTYVSYGDYVTLSLCFKTVGDKEVTLRFFKPYLMNPEFLNQKTGASADTMMPPIDAIQEDWSFVLKPKERCEMGVFKLKIEKPTAKAKPWPAGLNPLESGIGYLANGAYIVNVRPRLELVNGVSEPNIGLLTQVFMVRATADKPLKTR